MHKQWSDDSIQFPRLIAEINGIELTYKQKVSICDSMDITLCELYDLLDRGTMAFDKIKAKL